MASTYNLKKQIDLPTWEWLRFAPAAASATSTMCGGEGRNDRYLYYLNSTFWRYDTWADGWQQLASPNTAAVTTVSLRYSTYEGFRGNVLGSTSTSLTIAGLRKDLLNDYYIRITAGAGSGQRRQILSTADAVIMEHGVATATTNANQIQDTTKKWTINQHIGHQVRVVFGTGLSQLRKVLYNDANTLYFYDINYQQLEPWNNNPFSAVAPYAIPASTAGAQSHYYIESSDITVDTWDTLPDATSSFVIESGAIWMLSAVATAPWSSLQYYDVLNDNWVTKTALGGMLAAALGTDFSLEAIGERGGTFLTGASSTDGTLRTLIDSSKSKAIDRWAGYQLRLTDGTGDGQRRRIVGNNATTYTIERNWDIVPNNTTTYSIYGETEKMYVVGNGASTMFQYQIEPDVWTNGPYYDYGQTINMSCKYGGQEPYAINTAVRSTGGISSVDVVPTFGGTNYVVGDILTVSVGSNGAVRVDNVTPGGVVSAISIYRAGSGYSTGTGIGTSAGSGSGCTIKIITTSVVARVTLVQNHNFAMGDAITIAGCTEAAWNTAYTVLATNAINAFDIVISATADAAASNSQSVSVMVDASKTWTPHEHIGRIVEINVAGTAPTSQLRRITDNTATTLTLQSNITQASNGTSRYTIEDPEGFGRDEQWKAPALQGHGYATGGSDVSLADTTKTWYANQWLGYKFRIIAGTGVGSEITITSNTFNTLSYASQSFTPDATTKYILMDTFGLLTGATNTTNATLTDSTKNWTANQWSGKRVRLTSGAGTGQEGLITGNTNNTLTISGVFGTAAGTDTTFTILGVPPKGAGISLSWIYGGSDTTKNGRYLWCSRGGGSNAFDRYDVTTTMWDYTVFITPQTEVLTTGAMFAYDGYDTLYFTAALATNPRIYALNVNKLVVNGGSTIPYGNGAATLGNRMEVISTTDGAKYLYIMRQSGQEWFRTLLFW